jgi:hypothetical protein
MEHMNSMGSIMDTPFSTSIPIISTNLTSNYASNPSFSTHQVDSQLDYNILEEVGYEQGDYNEFSEGFPINVDEVFQQMNNAVQSLIQNVNVTPSISHGNTVLLNTYKWMKAPCLPWKVRYLNVLSVVIVKKLLNNILNQNMILVNANYF